MLRSSKLSLLFNQLDWCVIFHGVKISQLVHLPSCWWALGLFPSLCHVKNAAMIFLKSVSFLNECIHRLDCKWLCKKWCHSGGTNLHFPQQGKRYRGVKSFTTLRIVRCLNFCQSNWHTMIFHYGFDLHFPWIYFNKRQSKLSIFSTNIMTATD